MIRYRNCIRAGSSVGQSASLTQMRSQVRALFRPLRPHLYRFSIEMVPLSKKQKLCVLISTDYQQKCVHKANYKGENLSVKSYQTIKKTRFIIAGLFYTQIDPKVLLREQYGLHSRVLPCEYHIYSAKTSRIPGSFLQKQWINVMPCQP